RGGDQCLDFVGEECLLGGKPVGRIGAAGVGAHVVPVGSQVLGEVFGGGDRERVDDAAAGQPAEVCREPAEPLLVGRQGQHAEPEAGPVEWTALDVGVGAELL